MNIDILQLVWIVVFTSLAYWINGRLNEVPKLKQIISVLVVVVGVVLIMSSLFGKFGTHITVH